MDGYGDAVIETSSHHPASLPFGRNVAYPWSDVSKMYDWNIRSSVGDCKDTTVTLRDVLQQLVRSQSKLGQNCITSAGIAWKYLSDRKCKVTTRSYQSSGTVPEDCEVVETNE